MPSVLLGLYEGNQTVSGGFPHKEQVMQSCFVSMHEQAAEKTA